MEYLNCNKYYSFIEYQINVSNDYLFKKKKTLRMR